MSALRLAFAALLLMLAGCVSAPKPALPSANCVLPGQQKVILAELFFGRAIRGRAPLSDGEWADFASGTVTPNFPEGFTVLDGEGQWRDPRTERIARETTKILLVATRPDPDLGRRLSAVIEAYARQYHQQSVGVITGEACAAF